MNKIGIILNLGLVILLANCQASIPKEFKKSYTAKKTLSVSLITGNCTIKKSDNNQINVELKYAFPDNCFKYQINESEDIMEIKEIFDRSCKGESDWIISIPDNTELNFNSDTGDFVINGFQMMLTGVLLPEL